MEVKAAIETCAHCGDVILHSKYENENGDNFCCIGCRDLNAFIKDKGLNFYYHLAQMQKSCPPSPKADGNYQEYLKKVEEDERTLDANANIGQVQGQFRSENIHCSACAWLIERVVGDVNGVKSVQVDFVSGNLDISYDPKAVSLSHILKESMRLGYPLSPLEEGTVEHAQKSGMAMRLAVAGACFANVMVFALADYFGMGEGDIKLQKYFNWVSFVLSLPTVFYAATPFYKKAWAGLKHKFIHMDFPVSSGILTAFATSSYGMLTNKGHVFFDSVTGLVFFLLLGRWMVNALESKITFSGIWPQLNRNKDVKVISSKKMDWKKISDLKIGDVYLLPEGEILPCDGQLESPHAWIDSSLLTGESDSAEFQKGDNVYAGFKNLRGPILIKVLKDSNRNRLDTLRQQFKQLKHSQARSLELPEKAAYWFSLLAILLATFFMVSMNELSLSERLVRTATLLIVICPCALALAVPFSYGVGIYRAGKMGFFIRSAQIFRRLASIKSILLDKTGTVTYSERKISKWEWDDDLGAQQPMLLSCLKKLCQQSLHPVSRTIYKSLHDVNASQREMLNFEEIIHFGVKAYFKELQGELWLNKYEDATVENPLEPLYKGKTADCLLSLNGKILAHIWLQENIKPSVPKFIRQSSKNYTLGLVSGDKKEKVESFCNSSGVKNYFYQASPEKKLSVLRDLQNKHGSVLAIGDGFNDSLLLSAADVGIAVQSAVAPLKNESDILFKHNDFEKLHSLLKLSKKIKTSVLTNYSISLLYNCVAIGLTFSGKISPLAAAILMPLSTLSVCFTAWLIVRE